MKIDTGMAVNAMTVGRTVPRKKNRITATKTDAPISLPCSVVIEASMKLAWRKVTRGASMPAGSDAFRPTSASSMVRVSAMVSAVGCFWMPRMTAGLPSKPASPRLLAAANVTSAICRSKIGWPWWAPTARLLRSSSRDVRPMWRIRTSRPLSSRKPPDVLAEKPRSADASCSRVMRSSAMRAVFGCTWNCRTAPPIGMTCATPGTASSRGRSTQSAYSRTAIGLIFDSSTGIAICRISPMIELIGPMRGTRPSGRPSSIADSRSATSCRAR